jgi:hypothetical protein
VKEEPSGNEKRSRFQFIQCSPLASSVRFAEVRLRHWAGCSRRHVVSARTSYRMETPS